MFKPDLGGLHVTFTLEPALYFGILDFPGATKSFSYTRLLQVVDIPNRTPYQHALACKAEDNLHQFFCFRRFTCKPRCKRNPRSMKLTCSPMWCLPSTREAGEVGKRRNSGTRSRRSRSSTACDAYTRATVTGESLKPGKPYTPKRIDSGVKRIKRDLAKQNHLASKVRLDHPDYHQDSNRVDLVIDVRPGPIVKVRVTGAKLSPLPFLRDRQMKKLIPIFSEGAVDPDLVEEGRRNLIDFFRAEATSV